MADLLLQLVIIFAVVAAPAHGYKSVEYWEERHSKEAIKGYQWLFYPEEVELLLESLFPDAQAPIQPAPLAGSPLHLCELGFGSSLTGADVLFGSSNLYPDRHVTLVDFSEAAVRLMQARLLARHKPGDDAPDEASLQSRFEHAFPGLELVHSSVEHFLAAQSQNSTDPCDFLFDSSLFDTLLTGSGDSWIFVEGAFRTLTAALDRRRKQSPTSDSPASAIWISTSYNLPAKRIHEFARQQWSHIHSCRRAVRQFDGETHHFYINVIGDLPLGIQQAMKAAQAATTDDEAQTSTAPFPEYELVSGGLLCRPEDRDRARSQQEL